jgi:hypothetical protein
LAALLDAGDASVVADAVSSAATWGIWEIQFSAAAAAAAAPAALAKKGRASQPFMGNSILRAY